MSRDMKTNKDETIAKLMRLTWSSLDSHLYYISTNSKNPVLGGKKTQKKFVKEYIEMLNLLNKLL
jgi:hypothetical protein